MIESSPVRRALSRMRDEISPTQGDKARLRARILAPAALLGPASAGQHAMTPGAALQGALEQAPAGSAAAASASLTRWAALKAAGSAGAAAALTLLGAGGGIGFWLGHEMASSHARSTLVVEAPAPNTERPLPGLEPGASAPGPSSTQAASNDAVAGVAAAPLAASAAARRLDSRRTDVPTRAHAGQRSAGPNPLVDELALLRRVERALRNNDPALARALLGELDERFPDSRLGEERAAARRIADCRSTEPGASESARAFLREHGASVYRKRIAIACALDGDKSSSAATMKNAHSADTHDR